MSRLVLALSGVAMLAMALSTGCGSHLEKSSGVGEHAALADKGDARTVRERATLPDEVGAPGGPEKRKVAERPFDVPPPPHGLGKAPGPARSLADDEGEAEPEAGEGEGEEEVSDIAVGGAAVGLGEKRVVDPVAPRGRVGSFAPPRSPGVKAGFSDDNKQFNLFLGYLEKFGLVNHIPLDVSNRIRLALQDRDGRGVPWCEVAFLARSDRRVLQTRTTYPDGTVMFFPSEAPELREQGVVARATCLGETREVPVDPQGRKVYEVGLSKARPKYDHVPLDVAFLLDTTGSMGDEIERLKATIETIHFQISNLSSRPDVRFGMVLYRDRGDDYVTKVTDFTGDVDAFRGSLGKVEAGGGGDTPEDLQAGLEKALKALSWRDRAVKLLFVLADAPPHLDYDQKYTYVSAMHDAAARAIKIVTIGASGLPPEGEMVFRQMAQYTGGIFIFLTYGEQGESGGGTSTSVSHHTGSNWYAQDLDAIVVQTVKRELSFLTDRGPAKDDEYYDAGKDVPRDQRAGVLEDLFDKGVAQLVKYSSIELDARTPTAVLPVAASKADTKVAELLEDRLILALTRAEEFQVVERKDAQALIDELRRSGSDLFDSAKSAKVGNMVGAKLVVISRLTRRKDRFELFSKLVRVETGEVLSVSLLKMKPSLVE